MAYLEFSMCLMEPLADLKVVSVLLKGQLASSNRIYIFLRGLS